MISFIVVLYIYFCCTSDSDKTYKFLNIMLTPQS